MDPLTEHLEAMLGQDATFREGQREAIEAVDALTVLDGAEQQKAMQNSAQQLRNAHRKLDIDGSVVLPGPVLLVDDIVNSGWTLTVAGWLLRTHGSGPVHPFALAVASARDG